MSTMTWEAVGGLVLFVALLALAFYSVYRAGREGGYEEGRADAHAEQLAARSEERAEEKAHWRHAKSQPRADLPLRPAAAQPEPKPARTVLVQGWYTAPPQRARAHVSAADIPPVFWPPQASPSKHGAAETGTMLQLSDVATTGGFRAVTDDYIAQRAAETDAYLAQKAAEDAAYRDSDHRWESVTL